jgi:hypothetical protein
MLDLNRFIFMPPQFFMHRPMTVISILTGYFPVQHEESSLSVGGYTLVSPTVFSDLPGRTNRVPSGCALRMTGGCALFLPSR